MRTRIASIPILICVRFGTRSGHAVQTPRPLPLSTPRPVPPATIEAFSDCNAVTDIPHLECNAVGCTSYEHQW